MSGSTTASERRLPADDGRTVAGEGTSSTVTADAADVAAAPPAASGEESGKPESIGSKIRRPQTLVSFGIALAIIAFFARRLDIDPGDVWANIRGANIPLLLLAVVVYYASFVIRAVRWRWMLEQAGISEANGYRIPSTRGLVQIFLLSWFANCVIPAKLGDAYRSYLFKRASGASFSTTLGTILAERLVDLVVLFVTMVIMGLITFGRHLPDEATRTVAGGVVLLGIGAIGVGVLWFARHSIERRLPERLQEQFARLHDAVFACLRRPGRFALMSIAIWIGDGCRVYLIAVSLGAGLSFPTATFVALMSSLLTTLPITPGGLGVVEAGMIVVLKLVDVEASMAGSVALLDRVVSYWSIILVGLVLYVRRLRAEVK